MSVILPMLAILSITSEWTQRSGLSTFTLIPHRGRVISAKAVATLIVGVGSMFVAMAIGALGNIVGTAITGTPTVWDTSVTTLGMIVLGNVLGMMLGFTLGVVIRNSAGAIVGYFVATLVLPTLSALLAANATWFADAQPWVDFPFARGALFEGGMTSTEWAQLATHVRHLARRTPRDRAAAADAVGGQVGSGAGWAGFPGDEPKLPLHTPHVVCEEAVCSLDLGNRLPRPGPTRHAAPVDIR